MRTRPATRADAEIAAKLVIADDIAVMGEPDYSLEDLLDEWNEQGFDLAKDTLMVEDENGTIIAYAHFRSDDLLAVVDPRREGEGAGTRILEWAYGRAAERQEDKLRQGIGANATSARHLLEQHGFAPVRSYHRLERDVRPDDEEPPGLRPLHRDDGPALYAIYEAAWKDRPDYTHRPQEAWIQRQFGAHSLDPGLSRVLDGKGFAFTRRWSNDVAYLDLLTVHPDHAGQGLGTRLLKAVFAASRAAGLQRTVLNVASDNPSAVNLYRRVGMIERWRIDDYQKSLPH